MEKSEKELTHKLEDSLDIQLRDQLDLARQKRRKAEALFRAVSEEVNRAYQEAAPEIAPRAEQNVPDSQHLPVLGIRIGGRAKAYSFPFIAVKGLINDSLNTTKVLITLDPEFSAAVAFDRTLLGGELNFRTLADRKDGLLLIRDDVTGSVWQALTGRAIDGLLVGHVLRVLSSDLSTAFDWQKLFPNSEFYS